MTGYRPSHFTLAELVPPELLAAHPEDVLWGLLEPRMLWTLDALRERFGPIACNDWRSGGHNRYRGLRPHDCTTGAALSDHKFGRAADLVPLRAGVDEVRAAIRAEPDRETFKHITVVEEDVPWLHLGFRNRDRDRLGVLWVGA